MHHGRMADSAPPKAITVRVPPDLHARIIEFATRTNRAVNGAAVQLLTEALDARDAGAATPPRGTAFNPGPLNTR